MDFLNKRELETLISAAIKAYCWTYPNCDLRAALSLYEEASNRLEYLESSEEK